MAAASTTWSSTWWRPRACRTTSHLVQVGGLHNLAGCPALRSPSCWSITVSPPPLFPGRQVGARHQRAEGRRHRVRRACSAAWLGYEERCAARRSDRHDATLALIGYVFLVALTFAFTRASSAGAAPSPQIGAIYRHHHGGRQRVRDHHSAPEEDHRRHAGRHRARNPRWGAIGKHRSVHNNYLTLPVVFTLMLSNATIRCSSPPASIG